MPSYRLEEASTGRAGCQNKECKDAKVKILKGELRHGSWIDTDRFQSFSWRHWGCVTPKVVSNMQELIADEGDGDPSVIDGFEDLSEENQDKVRKAIEQGHVDDEDWKGDVEMNRPGKTGFRQRATKKAKADEDDESAEEPAKPKKRTSKAAKDESDDEAPKAKKAKTASRPKKAAAKDEEAEGENGDATPAKPKAKQPSKKGRPAKETPEKKAAPAAKTGGRRQKKAAEDGDAEAQAEAQAEPEPEPAPEPAVAEKPKRGRKKKSA